MRITQPINKKIKKRYPLYFLWITMITKNNINPLSQYIVSK
jgi:hypothetical protein